MPSFSTDEVIDAGERVKRFKTGKEKKRKHKVDKMKEEEIESLEDYDRQALITELDDQEFSSRGSKRKSMDNKSSIEPVRKKRPLEETSSYRERNSRSSSSKTSGVSSESDRNREASLWRPSPVNDGHKQAEVSSLDRHRDDRHGSLRKTKSYVVEEEYNRKGRERERDRPTDGTMDHSSRKRKR